jgi:hypothetical protein
VLARPGTMAFVVGQGADGLHPIGWFPVDEDGLVLWQDDAPDLWDLRFDALSFVVVPPAAPTSATQAPLARHRTRTRGERPTRNARYAGHARTGRRHPHHR